MPAEKAWPARPSDQFAVGRSSHQEHPPNHMPNNDHTNNGRTNNGRTNNGHTVNEPGRRLTPKVGRPTLPAFPGTTDQRRISAMHAINRTDVRHHPIARFGGITPVALIVSFLGTPCGAEEAAAPWSARPELVQKLQGRPGINYDEAKVPDYTLPDPLIAGDGTAVSDAEAWTRSRREDVLNLFRDHVYGRRPATNDAVRFEPTDEIKDAFDGAATGRAMTATVAVDDRTYSFPFVVFVPNHAERPVPAVVHINNRYFIPLEKAASEHDPFWPSRTLIERGYATASFHTSHVDPDRKDGYADGIRAFLADGQPPEETAWRSLSAWGWAASRILDHLESLEAVDGSRVAVVGHSRGGKASLWAACEDPRFAIAYSNHSGCGGAALSRRAYGETVGRITTAFPHWFCPPFAAYAGREAELPVDQHQVVGLIAPRGVYVASADQDLWADPKGEYASLVAAAPVFRLFDKASITAAEMPPLDHPRVVGQTGYHVRTGGHGLGDIDWQWFLDFADRLLARDE